MKQLKYDLEERTTTFGETVVSFCKMLKQDAVSRSLIEQLVRSATSIGANYREANGASSKKDFRNKIHTCKKESKESQHWIRILAKCFPEQKGRLRLLWKETHELVLIFSKISHTLSLSK